MDIDVRPPPQLDPPPAVVACQLSVLLSDGLIRYGDLVLCFPDDQESVRPQATQPDPGLALDVRLIGEAVSAGRWQQTFLVTFLDGGTLEQASIAVYGDTAHVDELFALLRRRHPNVSSAAAVQTGQQLEIVVDAAQTSVLSSTALTIDGRLLSRTYYNGVFENLQIPAAAGVARVLQYPRAAPVSSFVLVVGDRRLTVPVGSRVVLCRYEQGDSFDESVKMAYGLLSTKAIRDFESQTGWTYGRWPPAKEETAELVLPMDKSYGDEPIVPVSLSLPDTAANAKLQQLLGQRRAAGIFPVQARLDGVTYRVVVVSSQVTARTVASLLYGSDEEFLGIAEQAGLAREIGDAKKLPADFDIPLIGRDFLVHVPYEVERFIEFENTSSQDGRKTTVLLNGATISDYPAVTRQEEGLQRLIRYPNGYQRVIYGTSGTAVQVLDFIYYTAHFGRVEDDADRRAFIASTIWNWQRDAPGAACNAVEEATLQEAGDAKVINVLLRPGPDPDSSAYLVCTTLGINPLFTIVGAVMAGGLLFLVSGIAWGRLSAVKRTRELSRVAQLPRAGGGSDKHALRPGRLN